MHPHSGVDKRGGAYRIPAAGGFNIDTTTPSTDKCLTVCKGQVVASSFSASNLVDEPVRHNCQHPEEAGMTIFCEGSWSTAVPIFKAS